MYLRLGIIPDINTTCYTSKDISPLLVGWDQRGRHWGSRDKYIFKETLETEHYIGWKQLKNGSDVLHQGASIEHLAQPQQLLFDNNIEK